MVALYSLTLLLSAFLMFWLQLFLARMILPLLGGAPSVWNTCMVFFQALLLGGYSYAYFLDRKVQSPRHQVLIHLAVITLPLALLPVALPSGWTDPGVAHPIPWLLALLALSAAAPFFAISASAPLLQGWFARLRHEQSADPYFLYVASNVGSAASLLGYPFLLEPSLSLTEQSRLWAFGYGLLVALIALCGLALWRRSGSLQAPALAPEPTLPAESSPEPIRGAEGQVDVQSAARAGGPFSWLMLSLIPASLLYAVTTMLTTDVAAVPLLWIVPLFLYLASFSIAFASRSWAPYKLLVMTLPVPLVLAIFGAKLRLFGSDLGHWMALGFHLALFFGISLVLHRWLAELRPSADKLTRFFLWTSLGGVLGGIFNAILVPLLFAGVYEYSLGLAAAGIVLASPDPFELSPTQRRRKKRIGLLSMGILLAFLMVGFHSHLLGRNMPAFLLSLPLLCGAALALRLPKSSLVLVVFVTFALPNFEPKLYRGLVEMRRSFFGLHRVVDQGQLVCRALVHGTTIHGRQSLEQGRRMEPLTYYGRSGPMGAIFSSVEARRCAHRIAALGLGIGTIAAYSKPGQSWHFFEIDPVVRELAENPKYFSFLKDMAGAHQVSIGDGRLLLSRESGEPYDLLFMDAFSSDSVPIHLLTREAFESYLARVRGDGLIVVNISNHYLNLEPVLAALIKELGLVGRTRYHKVPDEQRELGWSSSQWAVIGRTKAALGALAESPSWRPFIEDEGFRVWTDDHSSIIPLLRFLRRKRKP